MTTCSHLSSHTHQENQARDHLEFVISEGGDASLQGGIPVASLGQLCSEVIIEGVQLGGVHRLLEQLLLHLLL